MTWILHPPVLPDPRRLGGKASGLAGLHGAGIQVPDWFVILPDAFHASLDAGSLAKLADAHDSKQAAQLISELQLPATFTDELNDAVRDLAPTNELLAVRSSSVEEDGAAHSFAGQLESYLDVPQTEVAARLIRVWQSAFTPRVWAYRRQHGLGHVPPAPAVLVQRMVRADAAGVAFSADPISGRRGVTVISAVRGLGDALVKGQVSGDTYHVARTNELLVKELAESEPVLEDQTVLEVARLARRTAAWTGAPQDIEWALQGGALFLVQTRPITTIQSLPDPDGQWRLWDNSNVVESYGGMTVPLTYSFARHAYEGVYREFCRLMKVPEAAIAEHADTFRSMIGYIRGRVFYNLTNWYQVLALLPGYKFNRVFMEQMMGVTPQKGQPQKGEHRNAGTPARDKPVPPPPLHSTLETRHSAFGPTPQKGQPQREEHRNAGTPARDKPVPPPLPLHSTLETRHSALEQQPPGLWVRLGDLLCLGRTVAALVWNHWTLRRQIRLFQARLDRALTQPDPPLEQMRPDELVGHFRELERQLLTRWDAPLINDFFAMIFHGVLRRLCENWAGSPDGALANDLIRQQGKMRSAEPAELLSHLAALARPHPPLVAALQAGSKEEIDPQIVPVPEFSRHLADYLETFGERCLEELKLESQTLHDDPMPLYRAIGAIAARADKQASEGRSAPDTQEVIAHTDLAENPTRAKLFQWVLRHTRDRVRDRENLRFDRTRVFGRVRRIFIELGRHLHGLGQLQDAKDVFFLELDEVLGFCEGTSTSTDLKGLAAVRRLQFERWKAAPAPPNRFESRGVVGMDVSRERSEANTITGGTSSRCGQGCCPGQVRGPVRVVADPRHAVLSPGEILVAERTDPGWILLFPTAAGLLVERGSLLSHSAIVARELGLPAVIGVPKLMSWLQTGDEVEMDGGTGEVRRLKRQDEPSP